MSTTTIQEMREIFLKKGMKVLKHKLCLATGEDSPLDFSVIAREDVDDICKVLYPIIQQSEELRALNAKSTSDVIQLLGKGKITPEQAFKLMEILEKQQNIEELPKLVKKLQKAKVIK